MEPSAVTMHIQLRQSTPQCTPDFEMSIQYSLFRTSANGYTGFLGPLYRPEFTPLGPSTKKAAQNLGGSQAEDVRGLV
jgi:hypothetical protein